jgi:hypothetical protein
MLSFAICVDFRFFDILHNLLREILFEMDVSEYSFEGDFFSESYDFSSFLSRRISQACPLEEDYMAGILSTPFQRVRASRDIYLHASRI